MSFNNDSDRLDENSNSPPVYAMTSTPSSRLKSSVESKPTQQQQQPITVAPPSTSYSLNCCLNNIQLFNEIYKKSYLENGDRGCGEYTSTNGSIHVKLESRSLWNQFASIGTEMIITKCGRFAHFQLY